MTVSLQFLYQHCSKFASSCLHFTYTSVGTNFFNVTEGGFAVAQ